MMKTLQSIRRLMGWLILIVPAMMSAQTLQYAVPDTVGEDTAKVVAMPWPQRVQMQIDSLLRNPMFETSQVGLMVYDLTADSTLYRYGERQMLRPASTMKLVTAIAAIDRLGGSYQFKTELCYTGRVSDGTLEGDVYCVGGMDPSSTVTT